MAKELTLDEVCNVKFPRPVSEKELRWMMIELSLLMKCEVSYSAKLSEKFGVGGGGVTGQVHDLPTEVNGTIARHGAGVGYSCKESYQSNPHILRFKKLNFETASDNLKDLAPEKSELMEDVRGAIGRYFEGRPTSGSFDDRD